MRLLVTGHLGYIGTVLTLMLVRAGHEVVGLDSDLYARIDRDLRELLQTHRPAPLDEQLAGKLLEIRARFEASHPLAP